MGLGKEKGVWRTINGRKVFIAEGENVRDAYKKAIGKTEENEERERYSGRHILNPDKNSKTINEKEYKYFSDRLQEVQEKIKELEGTVEDKYIEHNGEKVKITGLTEDSRQLDYLKEIEQKYKEQLEEAPEKVKQNIKNMSKEEYDNLIRDAEKDTEEYRTVRKLKSLSEIEQYYIDLGYSKATALRYAKREISMRKNK